MTMQMYKSIYSLFWGNRSTYAIQRRDSKGKMYYQRIEQPLTLEVYEAHLRGEKIIGIYPLLEDKEHCRIACFDVDVPDFALAQKLRKLLPQPNYVERSRSGNFHIWMFFERPLKCELLWTAVQGALSVAKEAIQEHSEIYPRPANERTDVGLLIALPFHHQLVERGATMFVDDTQTVISIEDFVRDVQYAQMTASQLFEGDKALHALWIGKGKKGGDQSQSAYDFAFCRALFHRGYTEEEVTDFLRQRPLLSKQSEEYIERTVLACKPKKLHVKGKNAVEAAASGDNEEVRTWKEVETISREAFFEGLDKTIMLEDMQKKHFDMFFAVMVATLKTKGRPIWMLFIGPPGGGKTLPMMAVQNAPYVYSSSAFKPTALISGYGSKGGEDMSLLPRLNGRVLMVKDMSSLLSQNKDLVAEVFGLLRDCYDGSCSRPYGTGVERTYTSRFGFIGATTPDIDINWSMHQRLGERFLKYRVRASLDQVLAKVSRVLDQIDQEEEQEEMLEAYALSYLKTLMEDGRPLPVLSMRKELGALAQLGAILRTAIARNSRNNQVLVIPEYEEATRYAKQLAKVAQGLAFVRGKETNGDEEFEDVKKLVRDAMDARTERICGILATSEEPLEASVIADKIQIPEQTVHSCLKDLEVARIVFGSRVGYVQLWSFVPMLDGMIRNFKLWSPNGD